MARGIHRLDPDVIRKETRHGHYSDGGGLYLQVSKWGTRSWVFKYTPLGHGKARGMGLGPFVEVESLAKARKALAVVRDEAAELRAVVKAGGDPIENKKAEAERKRTEGATKITFKEAVAKEHARRQGKFKNGRHGESWLRSLEMYAIPIIGKTEVAHITPQDILRVLMQSIDDDGNTLWETKNETATRLRGRIEAVLSWATVAGFRTGDNPARWAKCPSSEHLAQIGA